MDSRAPLCLSLVVLCTLACATDREPAAGSDTETGSPAETESETDDPDEGEGEGESETGDEQPAACWQQPGVWDAGYAIPGPDSVPGDPVAGEWALFNEDYVSCGVPYDLFMLGKGFLGTYADGESLPGARARTRRCPTTGTWWSARAAPSWRR